MRTIVKRAARLLLVGVMILGLVACKTNGATSDNVDNSKPDTSAPVVTEPVDTSSQTEEEVKETLEVELPPIEVFYNKDYDADGDWTISKAEWEKWCAEHPEDTNKNMTLKDEQEQQQQQQKPQIPDTSTGNPDPGSEQTSKPSTGGNTSSGNTSGGNSGSQTSKPSTGGNTSSGGNQSSGGNTSSGGGGQTTTPTTPPDSGSSGGSTGGEYSGWDSPEDKQEWIDKVNGSGNGTYYDDEWGVIIPGI